MNLSVVRDKEHTHAYTLGVMWMNGVFYGDTCEDEDRRLEDGNVKLQDQTAIPRGRYRVRLSMSKRFGKIMPELLNVPGFTGIRIHGGNTASDTDGCILLGAHRIPGGVADCLWLNKNLIEILTGIESRNEEIWIDIK